jgi:hypothetical protein
MTLHMARFYPQIDSRGLNTLLSIKGMFASDPDYFDDPECPYDEGLRKELKELLVGKVVEKIVEVEVEKIVERRVEIAATAAEGEGKRGPKAKAGPERVDVVSTELKEVLGDLRRLRTDSKTLSPGDKAMILKTQSVLLEKLIVMEERLTNIKAVSRFMSTVMGVMDDLMDDEQRQLFMKRIAPFATEE